MSFYVLVDYYYYYFSAPLPTISKSDDTINELDKLRYTARNDELVSEHRVTCAGISIIMRKP